MSLEEVYRLCEKIREYMPSLGYWQALSQALYSYGVVLAEKCIPSKVAERCATWGSIPTVQRRLERFLSNERIRWYVCCREWSRWVLSRYSLEQVILLVDESKIGEHLGVMMVALAYRGTSIPLVYWCYDPAHYPEGGQVGLISELLSWIVCVLPEGCTPILQADRGIGTSPELIRTVQILGWQFLFRIQGQTRVRMGGQERSLRHLVNAPGQHYSATAKLFKKAGWLELTIHILWEVGYSQPWLLVTNVPAAHCREGWLYALRYWQEASFRDLKSDGWHWQSAGLSNPERTNRLLLVLILAYAWMLTLGSYAFDEPHLFRAVAKPSDKPFSIFRLGLRIFNFLRDTRETDFAPIPPHLCFCDPPPLSITVGA